MQTRLEPDVQSMSPWCASYERTRPMHTRVRRLDQLLHSYVPVELPELPRPRGYAPPGTPAKLNNRGMPIDIASGSRQKLPMGARGVQQGVRRHKSIPALATRQESASRVIVRRISRQKLPVGAQRVAQGVRRHASMPVLAARQESASSALLQFATDDESAGALGMTSEDTMTDFEREVISSVFAPPEPPSQQAAGASRHHPVRRAVVWVLTRVLVYAFKIDIPQHYRIQHDPAIL